MKEIFPSLIGNLTIKNSVGRDITTRSQSHAYIIEGADGSGKHTLARLISAAVSCENLDDSLKPSPCGVCNNCKKILKDISADVVYVTCQNKASIGVEQIREIRAGLYVTPNDSDMRVYIIESAEKMTVQAQNALLLSLEEPPSFVMFLLLTSDAGKLLETIRSRAQTIRMERFDAAKTASYLESLPKGKEKKAKEPEKFEAAVSISGGALGYAAELLFSDGDSSGVIALRNKANKFVKLLCDGNAVKLFSFASSEFPKSADEAIKILVLSEHAVRDVIIGKKSGKSNLLFYADKESSRSLSNKVSIPKLTQIYDAIAGTIVKLQANISVKVCAAELILQAEKIIIGKNTP